MENRGNRLAFTTWLALAVMMGGMILGLCVLFSGVKAEAALQGVKVTETAQAAGIQAAETVQDGGFQYTNPTTGHQAVIIDELGSLSAEEAAELLQAMEPITKYGDAVYKTTVSGGVFDAEKYMDIQYGATMSGKTGVLVLLDAGNNSFQVRCGGKWESMINPKQAESIATIALNAYRQNGQAVAVPKSAFDQVYARLEQVRKARPVKYVCNAMLALILAMLINFVLVDKLSRMQKTPDQELLENAAGYCRHGEVMIEFLTRTETYSPQTKR